MLDLKISLQGHKKGISEQKMSFGDDCMYFYRAYLDVPAACLLCGVVVIIHIARGHNVLRSASRMQLPSTAGRGLGMFTVPAG